MLRVLVIAVVGMFLGGFAVVVYAGLQSASPPAPVVQAKVALIAAGHPVRAGSLLQPGDLGVREVSADQVPAGAHRDTTEGRNALVGAMVRRTLDEKEVIAADDVLRPGDRGFLAAVLQPGTRAVSVEVDAVSGEAGLIWPGDRVDLILTQTIEGTDQSLGHRVAGEMVLGDVRVIAVDQQLIQGGQANGLLEGRTPSSRTITLEVTPRDASRIAVATRLGKLQVVLRAAQPDARESVAGGNAAPVPVASASPPSPISPGPIAPAPLAPAPAASLTPAAPSGFLPRSPAFAAPVWGGDVSRALGPDSRAHGTEIRVFQGSKPMEAYKF